MTSYPNPSYIWRNILAGQKVWSIGLCGSQVSEVLLVLFGMLPPQVCTLCSRGILAWKQTFGLWQRAKTLATNPTARSRGNFGSSSSQVKLNTFSREPIMTLCPHISIFTGRRLEIRRCVLSTFRLLKQSHTSYGNVLQLRILGQLLRDPSIK